jgi:hypothetical protein
MVGFSDAIVSVGYACISNGSFLESSHCSLNVLVCTTKVECNLEGQRYDDCVGTSSETLTDQLSLPIKRGDARVL